MKKNNFPSIILINILGFFVTPDIHPALPTDALLPGNNRVQADDALLLEEGAPLNCCVENSHSSQLLTLCCGPRGSMERQISTFSLFAWGGTITTYVINLHAYSTCRSNDPGAACTDIQPPAALVMGFLAIAGISSSVALSMRATRMIQLFCSNTNNDE